MPVRDDTMAWRGDLPHLQKLNRTYDITFCSEGRRRLPPLARDIAMACIVHDHLLTYDLITAVVMDDHVHMVFAQSPEWSLPDIFERIKSVSSRLINRALGRHGQFWQSEYFDRIVRHAENLRKKCDYIAQNPVLAGFAISPEEYRWMWRAWNDAERDRWNPEVIAQIVGRGRPRPRVDST